MQTEEAEQVEEGMLQKRKNVQVENSVVEPTYLASAQTDSEQIPSKEEIEYERRSPEQIDADTKMFRITKLEKAIGECERSMSPKYLKQSEVYQELTERLAKLQDSRQTNSQLETLTNTARKSEETQTGADILEIAKESTIALGKVVGKTIYYAGHVFPGCTHLIPTIIRKALQSKDEDTIFPVSFGAALVNTIYYGYAGYSYGSGIGKELILSAVAGTVLSGIYESIRYAKNKVEKRKLEVS
jgi:hypothetical protein